MAKKATTPMSTTTAPAETTVPAIEPAAYYRVEVLTRFRFGATGFGPLSQTEVSGEVLGRLLISEHAAKVVRWVAVGSQPAT